jgi:signal transduction histidine kinase
VGHAFERFYLYDRHGAERPVGTGLGLAIVQELAQAMGGTAAARSTPGVGSTFSLLLAAAEEGPAARENASAADAWQSQTTPG